MLGTLGASLNQDSYGNLISNNRCGNKKRNSFFIGILMIGGVRLREIRSAEAM